MYLFFGTRAKFDRTFLGTYIYKHKAIEKFDRPFKRTIKLTNTRKMADFEFTFEMPEVSDEALKVLYQAGIKQRCELMKQVEDLTKELAPINRLLERSSAESTEALADDITWLWDQEIDVEEWEEYQNIRTRQGSSGPEEIQYDIDELEQNLDELQEEHDELDKEHDKLDKEHDALKNEVIAERKKVIAAEEKNQFDKEMWGAEADFLKMESAKVYPKDFNDFLKDVFDEETYKKMYEAFELAELLEPEDEDSCHYCKKIVNDDDETCMDGNDTVCLECYENHCGC